MAEHEKITAARKHCRKRKLRYYIKHDALFLFVPQFGRYMQTCFNLLNFNDEESICSHIDKQMETLQITIV